MTERTLERRESVPTCLIHIGAPKTGTTFLQGLLWANRGALAAQGVELPGRGQHDHFEAGFDLREITRDPRDPGPARKGVWEALAKEVLHSNARVMVISDERLAGASAEQAERAIESLYPAEVHIVYTIRDLGRVLPAEWQEYVKHQCPDRFDEWLSAVLADDPTRRKRPWFRRVHDADDVLRRWSGSLPPERVHVVTVPRPGSPPGLLWERFASLLGVDPCVADGDPLRSNASLSLEQTELLRRINVALPPDFPEWHHIAFARELLANQVFARRRTGTPLSLPAESRATVHAYAERLVSRLQDSDYDVIGDLAELVPDITFEQEPEQAAVDATEMLNTAVEAVSGLLQHMGGMDDEHRRRVAELEGRVSKRHADLSRAEAEWAELRKAPFRWFLRDLSQRNRLVMAARLARRRLIERSRRFAGRARP